MASPEREFPCTSCSKVFRRAEHLRRHALIHNQHRLFRCRICPKDFIRRDALQRHEQTHHAAPSLLQRGGRACSNCAVAKAKCSGMIPCTRCRDRVMPCTFPVVGTSKVDGRDDPVAPVQTIRSPIDLGQSIAMPPVPPQMGPSIDSGTMDSDLWDHNILTSTNWLDDADFLNFPLPHNPDPAAFLLTAGSSSGAVHPLVASSVAQFAHIPIHGQDRGHGFGDSPQSLFTPRSAVATDAITNSQASNEAVNAEHGEFYVDGEPCRLPRVKRRKTSTSTRSSFQANSISTFSLQPVVTSSALESLTISISFTTYDHMKALYSELCTTQSLDGPAFAPGGFLSKATLEYLVSVYHTHCDQWMPFLHVSSLPEAGNHHCLTLAMAAIGSHYVESEDTRLLFTSLHEFLRRVYLHQGISSCGTDSDSAFFDRGATLLHILGMAYSGNDRLQQQALEQQYELARIFTKASQEAESLQPPATTDESAWGPWCRWESVIRQAYCAWLVDCMWTYHFDCHPSLSLSDAKLSLPCSNKIWRAGRAEDWKPLYGGTQDQGTLQEALQQLFVDKKLSQDRGEFARVLIIHGLFHRLWDVERYLASPLSHWEPTAHRQSSEDVLPESPIWLPAFPAFVRWQNSACDCLDILHWQANAKIGKASGLEHPTVLHLHLARIILLTPFRDIANLARMTTRPSVSAPAALTTKQLVQRWAIQHQYKARLAVIHAGVLLWHVRRHSIDAFYEGPAVALAALVLWAFGTFAARDVHSRAASRPSNDRQQPAESSDHREDSEQSDAGVCNIILLDRPTDDELVQQFIRNGHAMQAHISGVGDLYAAKGPERVLGQAIKLLASLRHWGVTASWLRLLQDLLDVVRKENSQEQLNGLGG